MSKNGKFIVIEGIDGSGKTTQVRLLFDYFQKKNKKVILTAEPTDGPIGKYMRVLLKEKNSPAALDSLVFAADRMDHCYREILPKLAEGYIILADRYVDSSLVYQSVQGKKDGILVEWLESINKFAVMPDLVIMLDISPKKALERRISNNSADGVVLDKFEKIQFQEEIYSEFMKLAHKNPKNHIIVDASGQKDNVFQKILQILENF